MAEVAALESSMAFDGSRHSLKTHFAPKSREPNIHTRATSLNYQPCRYFDYIVGASTGGYDSLSNPNNSILKLTLMKLTKPSCYDVRSL